MVLMLFWGCSGEDEKETRSQSPRSLAVATNVKIRFTESGKLQAILYASKVADYDTLTWGWNLRADFFTDSDTVADGGMTADSGYVKQDRAGRRVVSVFGNVRLVAPDGTRLFADSLRWNPKYQQIESNSKVRIIRGADTIEGTGFVSDPNFKHIRVVNVRGRIKKL